MNKVGHFILATMLLGVSLLFATPLIAATDGVYTLTETTASWDGTSADRLKAKTTDYDYSYGDESSTTYALPWSFPFYGQTYNQITADTNGNIWFTSSGSAHSINLASTGRGPVISAWNDDLSSYYYGGVFVQHKTSPERVVVQWQTETYSDEGYYKPNSFEVVLFPNGTARLDYSSFTASSQKDSGSGISADNGTNYISLTSSYGSPYQLSGKSYIVAPSSQVLAVNPINSPIYATIRKPFSQTLTASGGTTPYTWSIQSGQLPGGITLGSGGILSGTPTSLGTFDFEVKVTDALSESATRAAQFKIVPDIIVNNIAVYRPASGIWFIRDSNGSNFAYNYGDSADIPVPGDYEGSGNSQIAVWRPSSGQWFIKNPTTETQIIIEYGTSGDIPVPADYDGDGKIDIAVFRPSIGTWFFIKSSDNTQFSVSYGSLNDIPVPADYDGDGKADIAVFRPPEGRWYIIKSSDSSRPTYNYGTSGDIPVPGDYDGINKSEIAVFRPSAGTWYILNTADNTQRTRTYGTIGDKPVSADYDGDGKTDIAVYRPSTGTWFIVKSSDTTQLAVTFGESGDTPVPSGYR